MKKKSSRTAKELVPAFGAHEIASIAALDNTFHGITNEQRAKFVAALRAYIGRHGYIPDQGGNYHDLIGTVAKILQPQRIQKAEGALKRADAFLEQHGADSRLCVIDEVWSLATPYTEAALHVGMALGVALIYNGGVRR